ncbi:MAG: hypothetical protein QOD40_2946 [Alphaproteobacteria bacterium]|jgi:hypothetical protein|nr:hypothetical protein [Alphaproteobacteria bacterium]
MSKPPKTPRQKAPVRHVALTDEAKRAYEQLVQQREERERTYGRHVHIAKSTHKGK